MNFYQQIRQQIEQERPDLWAALYPRLYRDTGAWESPTVPAVNLAGALAAYEEMPEAREDIYTQLTVTTAARLIEYAMPTYFVGRDLLQAVAQTEPPDGLRWTDMHLPFPAGLLMLPTGAVTGGAQRFGYVTWCRVEAGKDVSIPGAIPLAYANDALAFTTASQDDPEFVALTKSLDANTYPWAQMPEDGLHNEVMTNLSGDERGVMNRLARLCLAVLLALEARPTLISTGRRLKTQRRGGREVWEPNVIGASYRLPARGQSSDGTHASPRMHWRRGHFRRQRTGEGRAEVKTIWIEPTIVGGD